MVIFAGRGSFIVIRLTIRPQERAPVRAGCLPFDPPDQPSILSTCLVPGEADCANGQLCSLVSGGHWQGGGRVRTGYALPMMSHHPSSCRGPPHTTPGLPLVWPLFLPLPLGCGQNGTPLLLDSALLSPQSSPNALPSPGVSLHPAHSLYKH